MKRYFLSTGNIDKIDLYVAIIEAHPHPLLVFYLGQSNGLKSVLCLEKSASGQQIILSKSVMTQKRSLVTVTLSIRSGQAINKLYNTGSPIMKVLRIMKM